MEEMYKTVSKIAISNEVKENIKKNKEDAIKKERDNRIRECKENINKISDKFYKVLTNRMWTRIANKKLFYIDGEIVDKNRKDIKFLVADTTRCIIGSNNLADEFEDGCNRRYLNNNEARFIFYEQKLLSPVLDTDRNCIAFITQKLEDEVKKKMEKMLKFGKGIEHGMKGIQFNGNISNGYYGSSSDYIHYNNIGDGRNYYNNYVGPMQLLVVNVPEVSNKLEVFFLNNL